MCWSSPRARWRSGAAFSACRSGALPLEDSQAAAAVGQIALARLWAEALHDARLVAGQVLVTFGDTEERRRYLYARECLTRLLSLRAVPVINENDTVATAEIRYGDNDRLAARVATMASADLLVLLSDVDGLYTAPPASDPTAKLIDIVPRVTAEIEAMAGGAASQYSRGGMRTKIEAAKIATTGGAHMVIADGRVEAPIERIAQGRPLHLVPHVLDAGDGAQEMDRRLARAQGRRACRRGRGARAAVPARACCRPASPRVEGALRARRLHRDPQPAGRRDRAWPRHL